MLLFLRGAMTPDDLAPSSAQVYFQYDINGSPVVLLLRMSSKGMYLIFH